MRCDTIQHWQSGRLPFGPSHGVFDDLLALIAKRESELRAAKDELQTWLKRNREK